MDEDFAFGGDDDPNAQFGPSGAIAVVALWYILLGIIFAISSVFWLKDRFRGSSGS
jgi:hypothetical protein